MKKSVCGFLLLCFSSLLFAVPTSDEVIKNVCSMAVEDGIDNVKIGNYLNNLPKEFYLSFDYGSCNEEDCCEFLDFDELLASPDVFLLLLYKQAEILNPKEFNKLKTDYEKESGEIKNKIEGLSDDAPKSEKILLLSQKAKIKNRYNDAVIKIVEDYKAKS